MYKYIRYIYRQHTNAKYITIDPGIRNIGWCYALYSPYKILDIGQVSYEKVVDIHDNDLRLTLISSLIERLIINYKPDFIVIEKIKFIKGKYSFSECLLLKAVGIIEHEILRNNITLISLGNKTSQSIVFGKSQLKSNKENMYRYIANNKNIFINEKIKKIIDKKKYRDISDAIFISYAIYMSIIKYKKLYDL